MKRDDEIGKEELLLIGLCRLEFSEAELYSVRDLAASVIDWKYFSLLANDHGVAALAYDNLEKAGLLSLLPPETSSFLRNASFMSLARNTGNMQMMQDVLGILDDENIKVVLLKGMALELTVYGNHGLRQMSDADVLTAHKDCMRAYRSLIAKGFVSLPVKSVFHRFIIDYYGKHLPSLIRNGYAVEIHHDLFGSGKEELTNRLYATSSVIRIGDKEAFVPAPQIFFLYLLKHLHKHELSNDSQLRLYTDLVVMIKKYGSEILNEELLKLAGEAEMKPFIASKLWLLREFWNQSFPEEIIEFMNEFREENLTERFRFFLKSPKSNPVPDKSVPYRSILKDIPGFHRKVLFVLGDLVPTLSFMKKRYNCTGFKALLYYPHRLGKLVWLMDFRRRR